MSDIVERLSERLVERLIKQPYPADQFPRLWVIETCAREVAAEIARLTERCDAYKEALEDEAAIRDAICGYIACGRACAETPHHACTTAARAVIAAIATLQDKTP